MKTRSSILLALLGLCAFNSTALADRNYQAWSVSCADVNGDSQTTYRAVDTAVDAFGNTVVTGYNDLQQKDSWVTERYDGITGRRLWRASLASANGEARPVAVGTDYLSNVYVAGYLDVAGEGTNFCLVKYGAATGQEQWRRTYNNANSSGSDQITAMEVKNDGTIAVTGFSVNNGNEDFYTIVYNANGLVTWEKRHATTFQDRPAAITFAPNGDVVVAGKSRVFYLSCYCMVRYSAANGTVVRQENYDSTDEDEATDVAVDPAGDVFVTGRSRVTINSNVDWVVRTIKYNSGNGWLVTYNSPDDDLNTRNWWPRLGVDGIGNVFMSCTSTLDGFKKVFYVANYGNVGGNLLWSNTTTPPAGSPANYSMSDYVQEMKIDEYGDVIVTGTSFVSATGDDILTVKFNGKDKRVLWQQRNTGYSSNQRDEAASLAIASGGDVVVCGTIDRGDSSNYLTIGTTRYNSLQLSKGDPVTGAGLTSAAVVNTLAVPATLGDGNLVTRVTVKDGSKVLNGVLYRQRSNFNNGEQGNTVTALQGQPAPDAGGAKFATFSDPVGATVSVPGAYSFIATLTGAPTGQTTGVWTTAFSGDMRLALQTGKQVPGLLNGTLLASVTCIEQQAQQLVALVTLKGTGVTAANASAVIRCTAANSAVEIMRTGRSVTFDGKTSTVKSISIFAPPAGSAGHGRYIGGADNCMKLTLVDGRIVIANVNIVTGTTYLQAVSGSAADSVVTGAKWNTFTQPGTTRFGQSFATLATLKVGEGGVTTANDSVIVYQKTLAGSYDDIAREGGSASGVTGATFATLGVPVWSDGKLAFQSTIKGSGITSANNSGLWISTANGNLSLLVRTGAKAPDAFGDDSSRLFASFTSIAFPYSTTAPIFIATLKGSGVTTANNRALFAVDHEGYLRQMLRTGDQMGTLKVKSFTMLTSAPKATSSSRSFNDRGSMNVLVTFTNLTQSIVRLNIP